MSSIIGPRYFSFSHSLKYFQYPPKKSVNGHIFISSHVPQKYLWLGQSMKTELRVGQFGSIKTSHDIFDSIMHHCSHKAPKGPRSPFLQGTSEKFLYSKVCLSLLKPCNSFMSLLLWLLSKHKTPLALLCIKSHQHCRQPWNQHGWLNCQT